MRILFIGEVVGGAGVYCIKALLPGLKRELDIDLTIAAAEGATGGFGLGKGHSVYLHKLGVDVITTGDFAYYKRDMVGHIAQARYLLRPANYPYGNPGRGCLVARPQPAQRQGQRRRGAGPGRTDAPRPPNPAPGTPGAGAAPPPASAAGAPRRGAGAPATDSAAAGTPHEVPRPVSDTPPVAASAPAAADAATAQRAADLPGAQEAASAASAVIRPPAPGAGVISLLGQAGFSRVHLRNPFEVVGPLIDRIKQQTPIVLVDFHATTTAEKVAMSIFLDGKVSAVLGTHVRTLSADARLLPGGTAAITHSGRTGSLHSVGGLDPTVETRKFVNQVHEQSRDAWGLLELQGVVLEVGTDGRARSVTALRRQTTAPEAARAAAAAQQQRGGPRGRRGGTRR
jgi:calcineurin-like phosphoesterase